MNKKFENKLSMLKAVLNLLQQNEPIWHHVVLFCSAVSELTFLSSLIEQTSQMSLQNRSGLVVEKDKQRDSLVERTLELTSILFVLGTRTGDAILVSKVNLPIAELKSLRDGELAVQCRNMADLGRAHLADLPAYGIQEATLNNLDARIARYETSLPAHRISVSERKAASEKLKELHAKALDLVTGQLDPLMILFKTTHADFYTAYKNARKVVDYGVRHEKTEVIAQL